MHIQKNDMLLYLKMKTEKILIILYFVSHRMCIFLFNVDAISHTVKKGKNNIIRVITIQLLTRTDGNIRFELDFCLRPFVQTQQFCRGSH